jgi:hypothetical protein
MAKTSSIQSVPVRGDVVALDRLAIQTAPLALAHTRTLSVPDALVPLFPDNGLRRGTVNHSDSFPVILAMMAKLTSEGEWCAVINQPDLSFISVVQLGGELKRCVRVNVPDKSWINATAGLLDGCAFVVGAPPGGVRVHHARQLSARVQERDSILMLSCLDNWDLPPFLSISVDHNEWSGVGDGHGYLRSCQIHLRVTGRGAASRERRAVVDITNESVAASLVEHPAAIDHQLEAVS